VNGLQPDEFEFQNGTQYNNNTLVTNTFIILNLLTFPDFFDRNNVTSVNVRACVHTCSVFRFLCMMFVIWVCCLAKSQCMYREIGMCVCVCVCGKDVFQFIDISICFSCAINFICHLITSHNQPLVLLCVCVRRPFIHCQCVLLT